MNSGQGDSGVVAAFDAIPLHFTTYGAGEPTIVLIHGWSCCQDFWREQTAALSVFFRVVTLDLAGHGRSRADTAQRTWSMEAFGRDVEAVADAVGARALALVGHSMGGPVAVEAALRLGARCRLVLGVDTFTDAAFYGGRPSDEIVRRCRLFEPDFAGAIGAMVQRISGPRIDNSLAPWIAKTMSRTDPSVGRAVLAALLAWDARARMSLIGCPVETINSALLARDGQRLPLDPLVTHELADVGHFLMLEAPARFNALAARILEHSFAA